jgi:hypothetical protein
MIDPRFIFLSPDLRTQLVNAKLLASPSDPRVKRYNTIDIRDGKYNGFGARHWYDNQLLHPPIRLQLWGCAKGVTTNVVPRC